MRDLGDGRGDQHVHWAAMGLLARLTSDYGWPCAQWSVNLLARAFLIALRGRVQFSREARSRSSGLS